MKEPKSKVGLVFVVLPRMNWEAQLKRVPPLVATLEKVGLDVIYAGKPAFNVKESTQQAMQAKEKGADCIIYAIGTWMYAPQVVTAIQATDLPPIIWAFKAPEEFSLVGAGCTRGSLDEIGIPNLFIYGDEKDINSAKRAAEYVRAARVVRGLKGKTYGLIGGRSMGMYTAMVDYAQWKRQFGIEIEQISEHRVYVEAEKIPDEEAEKVLDELQQKFAGVFSDKTYTIRSIKLYLALKKLINEEGLDFIGVKCQPELMDVYSSYCIPVTLLNSEGTVTACECDSNGALTMLILHMLSGQAAWFGDIKYLEEDTKVLRDCNCGSVAYTFAEDPKKVYILPHPSYMYGGGRPAIQLIAKPGKVTCARLSRVKGEYVMLIFTGETIKRPREQLKETVWEWPHAFIKIDADPTEFIKNLRANHIHFVYGDYKQELIHICNFLGIRPILI
jgi:L-fucose isomerase